MISPDDNNNNNFAIFGTLNVKSSCITLPIFEIIKLLIIISVIWFWFGGWYDWYDDWYGGWDDGWYVGCNAIDDVVVIGTAIWNNILTLYVITIAMIYIYNNNYTFQFFYDKKNWK